MVKLHLGCGYNKKDGYINCDISEEVNPDKIVDLEKPLPFEDNTINEIYSRHTFEHIENLNQLMSEIYRVCKNGARINIIVPYFSHPGAYQDPTHVRFFTLRTFYYFDKTTTFSYYTAGNFKILNQKLILFVLRPKISKFFDFFINKYPKLYERFFAWILPVEEMKTEMEVVK